MSTNITTIGYVVIAVIGLYVGIGYSFSLFVYREVGKVWGFRGGTFFAVTWPVWLMILIQFRDMEKAIETREQ